MAFARSVVFSVSLLSLLGSAVPAWAQYQVLEAEQDAAEEVRQYHWAVLVEDEDLRLSGQVPYEWVADILRERAGDAAAELDVAAGAPAGFLPDALTAIDAAGLMETGEIAFEDGLWRVTGRLKQGSDRAALEQLLPAVGPGSNWIIYIQDTSTQEPIAPEVVSAVEQLLEATVSDDEDTSPVEDAEIELVATPDVDSETAEARPSAAEADPIEQSDFAPDEGEADIVLAAQCEAEIEAHMEGQAILFSSGSARLSSGSVEIVAGVAEILAVCPATPVYVEGHTDADGRAEANVVLSLARAEAVVDELVELGIDPRRLFAVGYGASLPIASNDTAAGKAANRRIVFSFQDIAD